MNKKIVMYSTKVCPFCLAAERLLTALGHNIDEKILIDEHPEKEAEMISKTNRHTVPQIFVGDTYVGGFDNLSAIVKNGKFKELFT